MRKEIKIFSGQDGFTLVELIVVIAILAILGGIGTVGYSAYVDKANKAADEQLISDIEQALILGAYSKNYAPGSTVGAVGVSREADATASEGDFDGNEIDDIEEMMINAFGTNWKSTLMLKSDHFAGSDESEIYAAIQAAEKADGSNIFDSVPKSSFYSTAGNTGALVADVDDIATALYGVLDGVGYAFSKFWGEDFHDAVDAGGLGDTWNSDDQMAANLTVFAAANQIVGADNTRMDGWIASWSGETVDVSADKNGYVADVVMQYAQCVAMYNYVMNNGNPRQIASMEGRYQDLEEAMVALSNPTNGYVNDFNTAIDNFWSGLDTTRTEWQESGQAATDAEAFLASMTALNTLEDSYVNKDQVEILKQANAFTNFGAANVLDTMVNYASMSNLPNGEYIIVLSIGADGTPVITPTLQTD